VDSLEQGDELVSRLCIGDSLIVLPPKKNGHVILGFRCCVIEGIG
jgi:hypothetical protein